MKLDILKIGVVGVLCISSLYVFSQDKRSIHPLLDPVFQKSNLQNLLYRGEHKILNSYLGISNNENLLLDVDKGKLYANLNGTGILYQIDSNYTFSRIDSTKFQGNNFGSAFFTYKGKIYNAGGYGFWNLNGSIRYFDTLTTEWSYLTTNKNIPFANGKNSITFIDKEKGLLYVLYIDYEPEYVSERSKSNHVKLQCYNLTTNKWWDKSYYIDHPEIKSLADIHLIHYSNSGLILNIKNFKDTYELNFSEKLFYKIDGQIITQIFQIKDKLKNHFSYNVKDTLVFYDTENDILKSIILNNRYKSNEVLLYFSEETKFDFGNKELLIIWGFIIFLLLTILLVNFFRNKNSTKSDTLSSDTQSSYQKDFEKRLDNDEIDVLKLILKNSQSDKMTSVEELNIVLGLKNKSYKIQNNIRADVINNINKKFKLLSNINDSIIERKRTDFDKRFFEYYLNNKYISKVSKFFS